MDSIDTISLSSNTSYIATSFGNSLSIYSVEPMKRIFFKEFLNYKISKVNVSDEGTYVIFTAEKINGDRNSQTLFIYSVYFEEPEKQLDFNCPIQNIVLKNKNILIILQNSICVYNISLKEIHYEQITSENDFGAGDLTQEDEPTIAVCGLVQGVVRVSLVTDERPIFFNAHQHQLSMIRFSPDSSLISTASKEGTIVKIFDAATGSHLSSFRRGAMPAKILSMAISPGNNILAVLSENCTIHFFPADKRIGENDDIPRATTKVKIDSCICAEMIFKTNGLLLVVASNGILYEINTKEGKIMKKTLLLSP